MILAPNRHNRGWPNVALLTYITETDQSWRYCIEAFGYRDNVFRRASYMEIIQWKKMKDPISLNVSVT